MLKTELTTNADDNEKDSQQATSPFYLRRIQSTGTMSCGVNLPIEFVRDLKLGAGDYVRFTCDGTRIMISPAGAAEVEKKKKRKGGSG
jgi:hypothetical protein